MGSLHFIDWSIILLYLIFTFVIGVFFIKKSHTLKEYAIGNRDFATPALVATLLATIIGTEDLFMPTKGVYEMGILWLFLFFGNVVTSLIMAEIVAPRIYQFFGSISAPEIMGLIYGPKARTITAIAGLALSIGYVASQIMAVGFVCKVVLNIEPYIGTIFAAIILTIYSALGGIRAVIKTDIIQFAFIFVTVPILCWICLSKVGSLDLLIDEVHAYYPDKVSFFPENYSVWYIISLFVLFYIPDLNPAFINRMLITQNSRQATNMMRVGAVSRIPFYIMVEIIAFCCLVLYPNIEFDLALPNIINQLLPIGIKGLAITGLIAVAMSTADSYLNIASVIFVHDILNKFQTKPLEDKKSLMAAKIATFIIGILSIIVVQWAVSILDIILQFVGFWISLISFPLLAAIVGFRAPPKAFLISSMVSGTIFIIWTILGLEGKLIFPALIPGYLSNIITFCTILLLDKKNVQYMHIIPVKDRLFPKIRLSEIDVRNTLIKTHTSIREKAQYITFGIFILVNYLIPIFVWSDVGIAPSEQLSMYFRVISGVLAALLIVLRVDYFKQGKYLTMYWLFTLCFCIPFTTSFTFLENYGNAFTLINLSAGIFLLATLTNWWIFVTLSIIGTMIAYYAFIFIHPSIDILEILSTLKYELIYLVVYSSIIGLLFTRHREYIDLAIREGLDRELKRVLGTRNRLLNNVSHEIRAPLELIIKGADRLYDKWENLTEEERKNYAKIIKDNNGQLFSYVSNILDIAGLESGDITINLSPNVNICEIVREAVSESLFKAAEKNQTLNLEYDFEIMKIKMGDSVRLKQVFREIIDNAIKFSVPNSIIHIWLFGSNNEIHCHIKDKGMGVDPYELEKIFLPFEESSRTRLNSGGRGIGLAIVKFIIDKHMAKISANNLPEGGAIFKTSFASSSESDLDKSIDEDLRDAKHKRLMSNPEPLNIVIIDDNKNSGLMLELELKDLGHLTNFFDNITDAKEYILKNAEYIDLVITDEMMPEMKGTEFIKMLRSIEVTEKLPMILNSGIINEKEARESMAALNINYFLQKPYKREELEVALRVAMKAKNS